jgi:hypothetical protein
MTKKFYTMALEELCAEIIVELQDLAAELRGADIASTTTKRNDLMRYLALVDAEGIFRNSVGASLPDIIGLLEVERDLETLGTRSVFDGWEDPEVGAVGTIREERILTDRGMMLSGYLERLGVLTGKNRILMARVEAERVINRKLGY